MQQLGIVLLKEFELAGLPSKSDMRRLLRNPVPLLALPEVAKAAVGRSPRSRREAMAGRRWVSQPRDRGLVARRSQPDDIDIAVWIRA